MPNESKKGRCRNCGAPFVKHTPHQKFCKALCRYQFKNLGSTPEHRIRTLVERKVREMLPGLVAAEVERVLSARV
jgi:ribosomal protein L37AE/L43A